MLSVKLPCGADPKERWCWIWPWNQAHIATSSSPKPSSIYDRREALPNGRKFDGNEGLGSRLMLNRGLVMQNQKRALAHTHTHTASSSCCIFVCVVLAAAYLNYSPYSLSCLPFVWYFLSSLHTHTHTHTHIKTWLRHTVMCTMPYSDRQMQKKSHGRDVLRTWPICQSKMVGFFMTKLTRVKVKTLWITWGKVPQGWQETK